jgi:MoaA/NifB/PqqE/SkfB family radical SAM enzyme
MSIDLSQADADALIAMPKRAADDREYDFPGLGERLVLPLTSMDKREDFLLDITRMQINVAKVNYQNRARQVVILMRLDLGGSPHRNPDGEIIPCPHLHIYREGYGDKWAFPLVEGKFENLSNLFETLQDFMAECNIVEAPKMQGGLF